MFVANVEYKELVGSFGFTHNSIRIFTIESYAGIILDLIYI